MVDTRPSSSSISTSSETALRRLGGYELLERVGRGATAEVWLARRPVLPGALKPCALKVIHAHIAKRARHRRMFLKEARLALKMSHANVVSVFDVGESSGRLFMALEWIDGVNLRDFAARVRAREGVLRVEEVCYVVGQILQGLRHAHELSSGGSPLGVIHRDVAPHNVMISAAGEVKLGDFGIARVCGEMSSGEHVKGRARYMAPEQMFGEPVQASDLFSVGAIMHELLEGRRFREGLERSGDWYRVVAEAPVPELRRHGVPPAVEALRIGLLHPDPRRRIATADEALAWLQRCGPWSDGAMALRDRYRRCVDLPRRTGLTHPISSRQRCLAAPAQPRAVRPISDAEAQASTDDDAPWRSSSRWPTAPEWASVVVRRRAAPALRPRSRQATWRRLGLGLWGLSAVLALVAVGLGLSSTSDRGPAACVSQPVSTNPGARAWVRLRGDDRPRAQVRIDAQVVEIGERRDCWMSPGVHELAWRGAPEEPWRAEGAHTLSAAKEHLLRVGEDGLAISAYDP